MKVKLTAGKLNQDQTVTPMGTVIDVDQAEAERLVGLQVAIYEPGQEAQAPADENSQPDPAPEDVDPPAPDPATPVADPGAPATPAPLEEGSDLTSQPSLPQGPVSNPLPEDLNQTPDQPPVPPTPEQITEDMAALEDSQGGSPAEVPIS